MIYPSCKISCIWISLLFLTLCFSLDPNIEPEVWLMTRAWYGISSTGGQAGAAIIELISMAGPEDQDAIETLEKDRFVDDLLGWRRKERRCRQSSPWNHQYIR